MIIQSVQRALNILSLFTPSRPRWGITEIASELGLAKGTIHNIVQTLVSGGFLKQDRETRRYSLGYRVFTLGVIMAGTLEINQKAAGLAHQLAHRTGLVSRVAVWDHDAALVTLNAWPDYADSLSKQIGPRVVAFCSAIGRALLAYLSESEIAAYLDNVERVRFTAHTVTGKKELLKILDLTRHKGYAINNQELGPGQCSIASAIFQSGGSLAAAISLSGSSEQITGPDKPRLVSDLRNTAAEISRYMGFYPAAPEHNLMRRAAP